MWKKYEFLKRQEQSVEMFRKMARQGKIPPGSGTIRVLHDDWCSLLNGESPECNCNPIFEKMEPAFVPQDN